MSDDERKKLQLEKLQAIVKYAYENVPYYRKRLDEIPLKPEDIKNLKDIEKLPFTTKDDLRDAYPFEMFAVPKKEIVEVHTSSGTTGKPTVSGYTRGDLEIWSEVMARGLTMAGVDDEDIIQNTHGYGLFTEWFWSALRCTEDWCNSHSNLNRTDKKTDRNHAGLWNHRHDIHTIIRPVPSRRN